MNKGYIAHGRAEQLNERLHQYADDNKYDELFVDLVSW